MLGPRRGAVVGADILSAPSGHAQQAGLDRRHGHVDRAAGDHDARVQLATSRGAHSGSTKMTVVCVMPMREEMEDGGVVNAVKKDEKLAATVATSRLNRAMSKFFCPLQKLNHSRRRRQ